MRFTLKSSSFTALFMLAASLATAVTAPAPLRPPSVPLVANDPYFSIWSPADRLTDAETVHWTGKPHPLHSMIRVDGRTYRLMGKEPADVPALPQTSLQVLPTRTIYAFRGAGVAVSLTFLTASLPSDLDVLSRPVTTLIWQVRSTDGRPHPVSLHYDNQAELVVNTPDQAVKGNRERIKGLNTLRMGSVDQPVLGKRGDDLRIDWGYLYASTPTTPAVQSAITDRSDLIRAFSAGRPFPQTVSSAPRAAKDAPAMAFRWDLGAVKTAPVWRTLFLAYDDLYSIEYMHHPLRPYWRRNGMDAAGLLTRSAREYPALLKKCIAFDNALTADLSRSGGMEYARIAALAYRQALAANKLAADDKGGPLFFPKENFSNGCISTVDILYPMAPQFLLTSPALMKASLVPVLDYAASPRWKWPFAPHDLGTYPKANGQVYGGGERTEENQMPVEESGNMLILLGAVARADGNAKFALKYWPQLRKWAEYLRTKGLDPENQLSTDDFAGHLAHNVNLSAKAILGLRAYAMLAEMNGLKDEAARYKKLAQEYAATWKANASDEDHYRLAFDRPGTWSQKYNLVWDRILDFGLFPPEVRRTEMAFYRTHQNEYGLPLDNRRDYTKLDWTLWTATLGTEDDFQALTEPVYRFLNATSDRVPMTDWYDTKTARKSGFQARAVVGGVFLKPLYDPAAWKSWVGRAETVANNAWAPMPVPPVVREIVPSSQSTGQTWRYTTQRPSSDWYKTSFDDSGWREGAGGFGTIGTPSSVVRTEWNTPDVWIRRTFELNGPTANLRLRIHHDEDAEVYVNGILAASFTGYTSEYDLAAISPAARAALKPGRNVLAVHCHQTRGGQYIDVGFAEVVSRGGGKR